jgi:hypothetical protein
MPGVRASYTMVPEPFHGHWQMVSYCNPGETPRAVSDSWNIYPDRIETPDFVFAMASVTANIEPDQDLHLINFSNQGIQFALLRSKALSGRLLVVWYLSGQERRRFLLVQRTPSRESETMR